MTATDPNQHRQTSRNDHSTDVERTPVCVFSDAKAAAQSVARQIAQLIRDRAAQGRNCVLGLATGSTPVGVYDQLVALHKNDDLSFANVVTFNLDEYWPMDPNKIQSYRRFMNEHLFDHIDIDPANIHIPDGTLTQQQVAPFCEQYEQAIRQAGDGGGLDLQLLGIGRTGHVGFNEPGSSRTSRTRLITLDRVTRMDAASDFFGEWNVPRKAITMGVGTILDAKQIVLIAFGEHKAHIVRRAVEDDVTNTVAASFLQEHPDARFILDPAAAAELTRFKTPWLLGPIAQLGLSWDPQTVRKAVIWLSTEVQKPILKLTDEHYNEHGLSGLLSARGSAYDINVEVFKSLNRTITGWPGGKAGRPKFVPGRGVADDNGPDIVPKRIVVFSPHPDDDVISMGGTLIRLCDQKHQVHVAYQTSGNIAVFDDEALRYADFVAELAAELKLFDANTATRFEDAVRSFAQTKKPGTPDSHELRTIKGLIRRTEAAAAARFCGVQSECIHFLDMPFYETGLVRKAPISEQDVTLVQSLLETVKPHQIYAAGDLSDPHGTHRVCLAAIFRAMNNLADTPWAADCTTWLYRGAWQEWSPAEVEMAVPLSPSEVTRKRLAIFKHQSQKDRALFPGAHDTREFWQRAEDRNRNTAELFDRLGLPEYQAIEGFVAWNRVATEEGLA